MKAMDMLEKLRNSPLVVFRISDLCRILGKSKAYTSLYLYRLKRRGYIHGVEKGKYALKDSNVYAVASNIVSPSYISFISALSYYKITTQLPNKIIVVSPKSKKPIRFEGYDILFVKFDAKKIFGVQKESSKNKQIFIGKIEKVIVDSLYLPEYCPIDETRNAMHEADTGSIVDYAKKMGSIVLLKRIGFLLEKEGKDTFNKIKSRLNRRYDLLNPYSPAKGVKNEKWRLIINE